jgi:hypothetical protein
MKRKKRGKANPKRRARKRVYIVRLAGPCVTGDFAVVRV